jgi:hypothetical protein
MTQFLIGLGLIALAIALHRINRADDKVVAGQGLV